MNFEFTPLELPEIVLVKPRKFRDERGFFMETYKFSVFAQNGIDCRFVQENLSRSVFGVLRGLHYQKSGAAQAKLVRAVSGEIFDVGVDIRRGSPTYGRWAGAMLTAEGAEALFVPAGFAHGFVVLSEIAEVAYLTSEEYSPTHDAGIIWNDPTIGIEWPIDSPILSPKDAALPVLERADNDFIY